MIPVGWAAHYTYGTFRRRTGINVRRVFVPNMDRRHGTERADRTRSAGVAGGRTGLPLSA
jgi:hypothetical protein